MWKWTTQSHDTGYCLSVCATAHSFLPFLCCWKGLSSPLHVVKDLIRRGERYVLCGPTTWAGVVRGMKTNNDLSNSFANTSDDDARRMLSLVKEVAVDGEEGAAHDAASGRGHFRHLWITNTNALTTNCPTRCNLVGRGKTSPANVWVMASLPVPKTFNTALSVELLMEKQKLEI